MCSYFAGTQPGSGGAPVPSCASSWLMKDIVRGAWSALGAFGPSGSAGVVFERPVVQCLRTAFDAMRAPKRAARLQACRTSAALRFDAGSTKNAAVGEELRNSKAKHRRTQEMAKLLALMLTRQH